MANFEVILTDPALADLADISDYISLDSAEAARKVRDEIVEAIDSLCDMPRSNKQVGVSRQGKFPIHWLIVHPYLVYYRIEPTAVYVLTVRHRARRRLKRFD